MKRDATLVVGLVGGSHFVNHTYLILLAPAIPALSDEFAVSPAAIGLAIGVLGATVTLLQLPFGYLSDTRSHRGMFALSLTVGAVGAGMVALAPTYEWLLVGQVVAGIGVAAHHPAHYPLLSKASTAARRGRAYSVHGFTGALGLAAPFVLLSAATFLGYDWRVAFGAAAVGGVAYGLVALVLLWQVPRSVTVPEPTAVGTVPRREERSAPVYAAVLLRTAARRAGGELRSLLGTPLILLLTLLWLVNSMAAWGIRTYTATYLASAYAVTPADANLLAGVMLAVGAGLLLVGGWAADRVDPTLVVLGGYGTLVVLALALGSGALPLLVAAGLVLVLSGTIDISRPARATLTDRSSAREDIGKNFALMTIGISLGGALAPPLFGFVIERASVGIALYGVGAFALVALGLTVVIRSVAPGIAAPAPALSDD